jgi:hypothetical protein
MGGHHVCNGGLRVCTPFQELDATMISTSIDMHVLLKLLTFVAYQDITDEAYKHIGTVELFHGARCLMSRSMHASRYT